MYGGITFLGWFHTILGIAAILTGLFLLIKENFISIKSFLGRFYLVSTVITAGSSLFIYNSTGSFNIAHLLSVITILAILLLLVGIAMAYESFFRESQSTINNLSLNKPELTGFSQFISNMSNDFPIVYGVLSIILAVTLAILAAFVRKLFSDYQDKKKKPA